MKTACALIVASLVAANLPAAIARPASTAHEPVKLSAMSGAYKGTVKFFNASKGFGFIIMDGTGEEVFVHITGLIDEIREKDKVIFNLARGKKGMNAVDVQRAG